MIYKIDKSKCIVCGTCELECRFDAVFLGEDIKFAIDPKKCKLCGACDRACPVDAVIRVAD